MIWIVLLVVLYIVGMVISAGAVGGVRDGPDGIIDIVMIVCWPGAVIGGMFLLLGGILYKLGDWLGNKI